MFEFMLSHWEPMRKKSGDNPSNRALFICASLVMILVFSGSSKGQGQPFRQIENPYEIVDWKNFGQYKANLNAHTLVGNGWMNPKSVVEEYKKAGYRILAITDQNTVTYPWDEFSKLKASELSYSRVYHIVPKPFEDVSIPLADTEFSGISPSDAGMTAIRGCSLKFGTHGVNSYFCDHQNSDGNSPDSLAAKNGLAVLNHPGQEKYPVVRYVELFERYKHLKGIEIFTSNGRHSPLLGTWDSILTALAPARPVWGFSNDDFYARRDLGKNWNVLLLPEVNEKEVRQAMENGTFFAVHSPQGPGGPQPPVIKSIQVNREKGTIRIECVGHKTVVWISNGIKTGSGPEFSVRRLPEGSSYVRAEIHGSGQTFVCTQPFIIR
jgi:hypothetical protein